MINSSEELRLDTRAVDGACIHVIDGMFDAALIRMIHETCRRLPFTLSLFDMEETPNPHWNSNFALDRLDNHPILAEVRREITRRIGDLYPGPELSLSWVHCNSHLFGDLQNVHTDGESSITAVYYVNADWKTEWEGETIFFDGNGDARVVVSPKPGRVVLFPSNIAHRGGVPSRATFEPRLSIALLFSAVG